MYVYLMANLMIYFELWQRKEKNHCASGAKTWEIFKISSEFFRKTLDFFKISWEIFRKTWEIFQQTSEFLGRGGGESSPQVGQRWGYRWKGATHLMQSSHPSGAAVTPIWCNLHVHLVQPSPIWGNLRPKEGCINKPSALGLVGKICIFAATSCRCGAHTIALSRVPRKALLTLRGLYPSCDHRLALTTSIYTLP